MEDYNYYISENKKKHEENNKPYDPITGLGAELERVLIEVEDFPYQQLYIPIQMLSHGLVKNLMKFGSCERLFKVLRIEYTKENVVDTWIKFNNIRAYYDFEFVGATGLFIKDKNSSNDIPFTLNRGQRIVLRELYRQLYSDQPVRIIIDKARQWGCSTLVSAFIAWVLLFRQKQCNCVIGAHINDTARIIRGMFRKILKKLPSFYWYSDKEPKLLPFEGSQTTRVLEGRGSKITIGSSQKPDSIVGDDISIAHFSEVSRWAETAEKKPEDMVQAIVSGILTKAGTMIIFESTGLGVGNFFHREWVRAVNNESSYTPIFVAWFQIDLYSAPIRDYSKFIRSLTDYEKSLFEAGATLEQINWYRQKSKDYSDIWRFRMEYPSFPSESFQASGKRFYPIKDVERARKTCINPTFIGEIYGDKITGEESLNNIQFREEEGGMLKVWTMPSDEKISDRYVTVVDIGGRTDRADNSVILVLDRKDMMRGGVPEVVAEWCGHCDHDILAWKAVQLSVSYQNALLIVESNTLESKGTEGDHFEYILDEIAYYYPNLYSRTPADKIRAGLPPTWGFHTNTSTKTMVCDHHKKVLRENMYIERDIHTCDEYDTFEVKENGSLGAVEGCRDDKNITRCIGVWACYQELPLPREVKPHPKRRNARGKKKGFYDL